MAPGLATAGDVVASGLFPRFGQFIPGTSGYHNRLVSNEKGALGEERAGAKSAADVARDEAQTEQAKATTAGLPAQQQSEQQLHQAQAENYISEAEARKNPDLQVVAHPVIDPADTNKTPRTGYFNKKTGAMTYGPEVAAAPVNKTPTNEMEKFFVDNPKATSEDWEKFKKDHPAATKFTAEESAVLRSVGGDPDKPETLAFPVMKKYEDLKKEHISVGADHGVSMIDPASGKLIRVEPGQSVPTGGMTPQQMGAQNAPTTTQRNVAGQAQLVHEQLPEVLQNIDKMKGKLGPIEGRWNDFMQGKVGMDDQDFAALRADLLMTSSAVALMHARGRLPENLREEFDHAMKCPEANRRKSQSGTEQSRSVDSKKYGIGREKAS